MKTTKKLFVLCLTALMAAFSLMPSTFSWYAHSGTVRDTGNTIVFDSSSLVHNTEPVTFPVPLSLKQDGITMTTYEADEYGVKGSVTDFSNNAPSVPAKGGGNTGTKNYITTFSNPSANKDVYIDFDIAGLTNTTNAFVGVKSPVINEKNFAARATAKKALYDKIRIYFEHRDKYGWWDTAYTNEANNRITNNGETGDSNTWCDMNLQYYSPSTTSESKHIQTYMQKASGTDDADIDADYDVFYQDIDASSDYVFFFNNYYLWSGSTKPNQTPNYTPARHTVYYFTGEEQDQKKVCETYQSFDLISVNSYYDSVTMAEGGTADIGLTRGASGTNRTYDYTANAKAVYSVTAEDSQYISVSQDGLVTAKPGSSGHTATVTTELTGEYGDILTLTTTVNIPSTISQVPVAQNLKIPAGGEVSVEWYVKNTGNNPIGFTDVFYTL